MGAKTLFSHSFRIAWKDLVELFRNRLGLVLLILMPLFMMVMVGFIYPSSGSTATNLPVAIVNEDTGFNNSFIPSQTFITTLHQINSHSSMMALSNASSAADIKSLVQKGDVEGGIIIPANFSSSFASGQQGTLIIITDQSNPQVSAVIQGTLSAVFTQMGTRDDPLGVGYIVVGDEHQFQFAADLLVVVDDVSHIVDEPDDVLGHRITGRRLAADDDGARHQVRMLT